MNTRRFVRSRRGARRRRGGVTVDMVATLGVTFTLVMTGYWMAFIASRNLHHLISSFVGSPYM